MNDRHRPSPVPAPCTAPLTPRRGPDTRTTRDACSVPVSREPGAVNPCLGCTVALEGHPCCSVTGVFPAVSWDRTGPGGSGQRGFLQSRSGAGAQMPGKGPRGCGASGPPSRRLPPPGRGWGGGPAASLHTVWGHSPGRPAPGSHPPVFTVTAAAFS